jgi:hypothetical protein
MSIDAVQEFEFKSQSSNGLKLKTADYSLCLMPIQPMMLTTVSPHSSHHFPLATLSLLHCSALQTFKQTLPL